MAETRSLIDDLAMLARSESGACSDAHDDQERERLVAAVAARGAGRSPIAALARWWSQLALPTSDGGQRRRWTGGLAIAVAVAVVLFVAWPDAALDYQLHGATLAEGGYVRAQAGAATLSFSDGSVVELERGAVARVIEIDSHGARLVLESGQVGLQITPADGANWSVAAGPYVVVVTGTRFDVLWQPSEQALDVALHEGAIRVRGPHIADGVTLRAGQTLAARLADERVELGTIDDEDEEAGESAAPTAAAKASTDEPAPAPAPRRAADVPGNGMSWAKRVAAGDFDVVLSEADARGVDSVLQSAPLGELSALSDAARYRGKTAIARRALSAVRQRFSSTKAAHTAAFLLGRMSKGSGAIQWYDQYLAEAPNGTYASEAMGRKMLLLRNSNRGAARSVARRYLKRFPKGGYASVARELLDR